LFWNPKIKKEYVKYRKWFFNADNCVRQNYSEPILLERTEIAKLNNLDANRMFCQAIEKHVITGESENVSITKT
jgi:hypothetical protein